MKKLLSIPLKLSILSLASLAVIMSCTNDQIEAEEQLTSVSSKATSTADVMVMLKEESLSAEFLTQIENMGATIRSTTAEIGIVNITAKKNITDKIAKLAEVRSVMPDLNLQWIAPPVKGLANPPSIGDNEGLFFLQWDMDAIDAPEAWNAGYTGSGATVFVLDSGIDQDHPDLAPNLNTGLSTSFVPGESYISETGFNHGTHVAGTIAAADNSYGIIGVAPNAEIVAVKVLSSVTGSGAFSWINNGIIYAANNGADVINMSLGATLPKNGRFLEDDGSISKIPSVAIAELKIAQQRAINYAYGKGVTIVVAAGNDYTNADGNGSNIILPADLQNIITVSATAPEGWGDDPTTNLDIPASYTNYGKSLITVSGPGGDFDYAGNTWFRDMVVSTSPDQLGQPSFFYSAGTSMASPHVAGVAALIIGKNGGEMSPKDVTTQITNTADQVDGKVNSLYHGKGRVNAYRAVTE